MCVCVYAINRHVTFTLWLVLYIYSTLFVHVIVFVYVWSMYVCVSLCACWRCCSSITHIYKWFYWLVFVIICESQLVCSMCNNSSNCNVQSTTTLCMYTLHNIIMCVYVYMISWSCHAYKLPLRVYVCRESRVVHYNMYFYCMFISSFILRINTVTKKLAIQFIQHYFYSIVPISTLVKIWGIISTHDIFYCHFTKFTLINHVTNLNLITYHRKKKLYYYSINYKNFGRYLL